MSNNVTGLVDPLSEKILLLFAAILMLGIMSGVSALIERVRNPKKPSWLEQNKAESLKRGPRRFKAGQKVLALDLSFNFYRLYPVDTRRDPTKKLIKLGWIEELPDGRFLIKRDWDDSTQWEILLMVCG